MSYEALHGNGIFAEIRRTRITVGGADRLTLLHNLCTNDVRSLPLGGGVEAFFTSVQGKTLGHAFLFGEAEQVLIDGTPGQAETLLSQLDKYVIREDVTFNELADDHTVLMAGTSLPASLAQGLPQGMLEHRQVDWQDVLGHVRRVPLAVSPCWLVSVPSASRDALCGWLADQGLVEAGDDLVEYARLEAAFPRMGQDISSNHLPQEVGRDAEAISFTKGCYLGQETVARIDALGHVNRHLVTLRFESEELPARGAELTHGGAVAGQITSVAHLDGHPTLALATLKRTAVGEAPLTSPVGPAHIVRLPG